MIFKNDFVPIYLDSKLVLTSFAKPKLLNAMTPILFLDSAYFVCYNGNGIEEYFILLNLIEKYNKQKFFLIVVLILVKWWHWVFTLLKVC